MSMDLVVEDGSGIPGADSYNSISELDAYMQKFGYDLWPVSEQNNPSEQEPEPEEPESPTPEDAETGLSEDDSDDKDEPDNEQQDPEVPPKDDPVLHKKQAAARKAALYIDAKYGIRFTGTPTNPEQGLAWPRQKALTYYGSSIGDHVVPAAIKNAHAEVTRLAYEGVKLAQQTTAGPLLTRKKIDTLEWEWDVNTYNEAPVFGWVDQLLEPLLGPAEQSGALDILGIERA